MQRVEPVAGMKVDRDGIARREQGFQRSVDRAQSRLALGRRGEPLHDVLGRNRQTNMSHAGLAQGVEEGARRRQLCAVDPAVGVEATGERGKSVGRDARKQDRAGLRRSRPQGKQRGNHRQRGPGGHRASARPRAQGHGPQRDVVEHDADRSRSGFRQRSDGIVNPA
jgi:hypothetical protein